jgi:hypothetical protein
LGGKLSQKNGRRMAGGKPIPARKFALPGQRYPVDTAGRARNALSRIAQNGSPAEKAKVRSAVKSAFPSIQVGTASNLSNGYDFADDGDNDIDDMRNMGDTQCPNCGYRSDSADFKVSGGASGTSDSATSDLRTPSGGNVSSTGYSSQQLGIGGAASGNMGLANGRGRSVELARRQPVRQSTDLVTSRAADGSSVIRHRMGGGTVGSLRQGPGGVVPVVDGKALPPQQNARAALLAMVGAYNKGTMPLQSAPQQTPLMSQFGVPAIRLAADDTPDNDDNNGGSTRGLSAKGQSIYKKLLAKGMSPKVAMAFAKRSENAKPGVFSTSTSKAS